MARSLHSLYSPLTPFALWHIAGGKEGKMAFRFEKLEIFQMALDFAAKVYGKADGTWPVRSAHSTADSSLTAFAP
jgi:hypothetical protein